MEFSVARAMQMSYLTMNEIERIHEVEKRCGYCLPNWNVQKILCIPSIKEKYGIPDEDDGAQERHTKRIRNEIYKLLSEEGTSVTQLSPEDTHGFDWIIHDKGPEMIWEYVGRNTKSRLIDQL